MNQNQFIFVFNGFLKMYSERVTFFLPLDYFSSHASIMDILSVKTHFQFKTFFPFNAEGLIWQMAQLWERGYACLLLSSHSALLTDYFLDTARVEE